MPTTTINFDNTAVAFQDKTSKELRRDRLFFRLVSNKSVVSLGTAMTEALYKIHFPLNPIFRHTIFDKFVGAESLAELTPTVEALAARGVGCLINFGVEAEDSEEDYDRTIAENLDALSFAKDSADVQGVCVKMTGFGRFSLFEKVQSGAQLSPSEDHEFERIKLRLELLCDRALACNTAIYFDAEEYWIQEVLDELVLALMRKYNRDGCVVYDTFQLYRWDQLDYLKTCLETARSEGFVLGAKLVRGAYVEKERERAEKLGYRSPIHETREAVDEDYNAAVDLCLHHLDEVAICLATHNEQSCLRFAARVPELKLSKDHPHMTVSQLYGMGDHITFNLAEHGYRATKYVPYGPVQNIIPYLIRRADENTSVKGQMGRELGLISRELNRRNGRS